MTTGAPRRMRTLMVGLGAALGAAWLGSKPLYYTRLMITSRRQPLWRTPAALGLPFAEVSFPASDGVTIRGWFISAAGERPAPAVAVVHGWPWNRLGNLRGHGLDFDRDIDLLEPAAALHRAGINVLLFDLRNHGASDRAIPVTFGVHEARDLSGAVAWLRRQPQVDGGRIGVLGYSMGANTALFAIPACQPIRCAIAVQPVRATTFARRFARQALGPHGPALISLLGPIHQAFGAPPLRAIDPTPAARALGDTVVQYIQGAGDQWGAVEDVEAMAAATPRALPLVLAPSEERYGGYQYINAHLTEMVAFFQEHLT